MSHNAVRFRLPEWDVEMPDALVWYWTAWNERDSDLIPQHLARSVADGIEWNDPRDSFVGVSALTDAIRRLRARGQDYRFVIVSEMDHHHGRFRYRWDMLRGGRTMMEGLDIVTLGPASGLITRVDGFFGSPTPIKADESGVPASLRGHSG